MPSLSQTIITNVGAEYIELYLKQKGFARTDEEKGQELKYWVDALLNNNKINLQDFEEFLFDELFWGKRKTIHIYKLDALGKIKYPSDWEAPLKEKYGVDSLEYCDILKNIPSGEEARKVVAVTSQENGKGELVKLRLLFVSHIQINGERGYKDSTAYIPVEIDFTKKIMSIKAWNRQHVAHDEDKVENLIEHIKKLMVLQFNVPLRNYMAEHKKVLFMMSKTLISEAYSHVATYNQIGTLDNAIEDFMDTVVGNLSLIHRYTAEDGKIKLDDGITAFDEEIKNVIEGLVITDYFHEKNFDEIWEMGLEAVVARIKFNDREQVLTSLSGENTSVPIFCTKTFMTLKKRMEESEKIETLWIAKERKRGNLNLKFDATNQEYLEILIRYGIRFDEEDMDSAIKLYEKYEGKLIEQTSIQNKAAVG